MSSIWILFVNRSKGNVSGKFQNHEFALGTVQKNIGMHASTDFHCILERVKRSENLGWITLSRMCQHLKDPGVTQSGCYSTERDESGASISLIAVFLNMTFGTSRMNYELKDNQNNKCNGEEPLLSEMEDSLWRHTASGPGQQIKKGKYACIMDKLSGKNGSQQTVRSPQNLKEFVAFDAFLENAISDNYRYLGFKTEFVIN